MGKARIEWCRTPVKADGQTVDLVPIGWDDSAFDVKDTASATQSSAAPSNATYAVVTMDGADALARIGAAIANDKGVVCLNGAQRVFPVTSGDVIHFLEI